MSTPGGDARLDDSVLEFVDRPLFARTMYGWGWGEGHDGREDSAPVEVAPSFQFRLAEFYDWNDERRGGIGRIEQPGHIYDGKWLLFYTRVCGCFDFDRRLAYYNLHIGRNRPGLYPPSHCPKMAEAWPLPNFGDGLSVWGYGQIAATRELMEAYEHERGIEREHRRAALSDKKWWEVWK
jgi:hypothetical protein